jgi:hypothetical protein
VKGSFPFVRGGAADGGGLPNATPSTVGVIEGLILPVCELVGVVLAGHALLLGLTSAKPRNMLVGDVVDRGLSGIGGGAGATPGLAVTVTTMLSDSWVPCACASAPSKSVATPTVAALSMNVTIDARRRDREFTLDAGTAG